jgi:hypothetical protein
MGTHDRGRPGIATGCTELAPSLDDVWIGMIGGKHRRSIADERTNMVRGVL